MIESIWNIPAVPMQIKYNHSKAKSEVKPRDLDDELSLAMLSSTPRSHHHAKHRSRPRLLQRSQALTERERKLAFNWTNTCVTGDQTPRFGIKRSKTLLEKPEQVYKPRKWYSEPSTADFIRHLRNWNKVLLCTVCNNLAFVSCFSLLCCPGFIPCFSSCFSFL